MNLITDNWKVLIAIYVSLFTFSVMLLIFKYIYINGRKIANDTLKIHGKYSMKRILVAISFPFTLMLGTFITISDTILKLKEVNPFAIQVFMSMLTFISVAIGISAYAKKQELKSQVNNPNEE